MVIADAHRILLGVEQCVMSICSWNLLLEFIRLSCQQDSEEQDREQEHVDSESAPVGDPQACITMMLLLGSMQALSALQLCKAQAKHITPQRQ